MVTPAPNILEAYLRDWFALVYLFLDVGREDILHDRLSVVSHLWRAILSVHDVGEVRVMCRYFAPCSSNIVGKRKRTNQMSTLFMNPSLIHMS